MFENTKTIIFDWDGTLHESMAIYYDAFCKAYDHLVKKGYAKQRIFSKEEVSKFLGVNPKDMWTSVLPLLTDAIFTEASMIVSNEMAKSIEEKKAILYPNAIEVLQYLKDKGYTLVYLSNSKNYYMEAMRNAFNLDRYFDYFYVSEMFQYIPKKNILEKVKSELNAPMVMIGDRHLDIETGVYNKIKTIGCSYGYGSIEELSKADLIISSLKELLTIF